MATIPSRQQMEAAGYRYLGTQKAIDAARAKKQQVVKRGVNFYAVPSSRKPVGTPQYTPDNLPPGIQQPGAGFIPGLSGKPPKTAYGVRLDRYQQS